MLSRLSTQYNGMLDQVSIALSAVCMVHCAVLPLALVGVPVLGTLTTGGAAHFHGFLLAIAVPISVLALGVGVRRHGDKQVLITGALGIVLLTLGATVFHEASHVLEIIVTMAGSIFLVRAHWLNLQLCRALGRPVA